MRSLDIKVVLIEEAAEVLEAHVLACLAPSVQQLILIGGGCPDWCPPNLMLPVCNAWTCCC